jgi:hypothetical protein
MQPKLDGCRDSRCGGGDFRAWDIASRKWLCFRGPVPGNEVRAIAAGRQTVASGNVRSKVSWGEVVREMWVGVWARTSTSAEGALSGPIT